MAFSCKDPSLTYLNRYGYNVVTLPRTGLDPLLVLGRDQTLTPLGQLATVWKTTGPPPLPTAPQRAANVEGQKTDKLDLSLGLKMLANALAAFGATTPSLEFAYERARKVQFTLTNVWSVGIDPFTVGEYLASGDLNLSNPVVARFLNGDSTAYIVTEVLKSNSVAVTASDSDGMAIGVDVPAISNAVGAKIAVSIGSDQQGAVTYTGPELVTFGFKALEIAYSFGRWGVLGVNSSGDMAFAHEEQSEVEGVIFNLGGLVRL
jgi:hypothetical protein